jgi:hypothetical protein
MEAIRHRTRLVSAARVFSCGTNIRAGGPAICHEEGGGACHHEKSPRYESEIRHSSARIYPVELEML